MVATNWFTNSVRSISLTSVIRFPLHFEFEREPFDADQRSQFRLHFVTYRLGREKTTTLANPAEGPSVGGGLEDVVGDVEVGVDVLDVVVVVEGVDEAEDGPGGFGAVDAHHGSGKHGGRR